MRPHRTHCRSAGRSAAAHAITSAWCVLSCAKSPCRPKCRTFGRDDAHASSAANGCSKPTRYTGYARGTRRTTTSIGVGVAEVAAGERIADLRRERRRATRSSGASPTRARDLGTEHGDVCGILGAVAVVLRLRDPAQQHVALRGSSARRTRVHCARREREIDEHQRARSRAASAAVEHRRRAPRRAGRATRAAASTTPSTRSMVAPSACDLDVGPLARPRGDLGLGADRRAGRGRGVGERLRRSGRSPRRG